MTDRNSLAFWLPPLVAAGLPVPQTVIVETRADLATLLVGETPRGWTPFVMELLGAGDRVGWPCFLRTGHGSGKHDWSRCCYVPDRDALPAHVAALVEWSHLVDFAGLPTDVWAVRELIPTAPLFTCPRFGGFPVVREFRLFVRDGTIEHVQPYWPADAVAEGAPDDPDWRAKLARAAELGDERGALVDLACRAGTAVDGGYWSVDLLEDRDGRWWLTDMAEGERSFRYEP